MSSFFHEHTGYCKATPLGWHSRLVLSALFFRQHSWQAGSNTERRNALITVTLFAKSMGIVAPCKYTKCLSWYELRSLETRLGVSVWVESLLLPPSCLQVPFSCDYGHLLYRAEPWGFFELNFYLCTL